MANTNALIAHVYSAFNRRNIDMVVFIDESLTKDVEIAFNAGSHNELIRLLYEDFERLVKPKVLKFAVRIVGAHSAP